MSGQPATEPTSEQLFPPLASRIRDTFVAPGRLAREIRRAAPWVDVLLLSTIVAALTVLAVPDSVFVEQMEDAVTRRGEPVEITSSPAEIARWGRAIAMLSTIATHPIVVFTLAGVLALLFGVIGKGATRFREYLSLTAHAMLIPAAGSIVFLLVSLVTGSEPEAAGQTAGPGGLISGVLGAVDPFAIWMLVVLAVGVNRIDPRHPTWRAIGVLLAGYLALLLATTALVR